MRTTKTDIPFIDFGSQRVWTNDYQMEQNMLVGTYKQTLAPFFYTGDMDKWLVY